MIYCPHCKKPSAQNHGECPHCGLALSGSAVPAKKVDPSKAQPGKGDGRGASSSSAGTGMSDPEIDFGESTGGSGLELESVQDPAPNSQVISIPGISASPSPSFPAPSSISLPGVETSSRGSFQEEASLAEIRKTAGFGVPAKGILGTITYGLTVRRRLKELQVELEEARIEKESSWETLEMVKARLGKCAYEDAISHDSIEKLVSSAVKLEQTLLGVKQEEEVLKSSHLKKIEAIDSAMVQAEQDAAPIRQLEIGAQAKADACSTDLKRMQAKVKRFEIELRNISEIINKRQQEYGDLERPKEERQQLLAQIAEFDNKQQPIQEQLDTAREQLAALSEPLAVAQGELDDLRRQLGVVNEKIATYRREKETLETAHAAAESAIRQKMDGESKQVQKAWAEVGERVYVNQLFLTDRIQTTAKEVKRQSQAFFASQNTLERYERAITCYETEVYKQSKMYMMIGAAMGGALLIAVVSVLLF